MREAVFQRRADKGGKERGWIVDARVLQPLRRAADQRDEMVRCVTERGMIERAPLLGDFDRDPAERREDITRPFDGLAGHRGDREPRTRHAADFAFGIVGKGHSRMERGRHRAGHVERSEEDKYESTSFQRTTY